MLTFAVVINAGKAHLGYEYQLRLLCAVTTRKEKEDRRVPALVGHGGRLTLIREAHRLLCNYTLLQML